MLYRNALWEYDGAAASWTQRAVPATLTNCSAATMMTFDGTRNRTVVVGCAVPGKTWEWDGTTWSGPFAGPFIDSIPRGDDSVAYGVSTLPFNSNFRWKGTLQLPWAHPNALFESQTLGGVGLTDSAGTLRTWNGSAWTAAARLTEGHLSDAALAIFVPNVFNYGLPYSTNYINDYDYVPNTFSPPMVEDYNGSRLLAFRDGVTGLRELRFADPPAQRQWQKTYVGNAEPIPSSGPFEVVGPNGSYFWTRVHPHPFELLSPEHISMQAITDPASRTDWAGQVKTSQFSTEEWLDNLYWPFRLLSDPVAHRVRVLTHRGAIWEMGSEGVQTRGGPCVSKNDCSDGNECEQGVCCYSACSGSCQTCNGAHPGTCETMAAGSVCQAARCANGILTSTAQCSDAGVCGYTGASQACAGGLACAALTACKTHCSTSADCADPTQVCSADGNTCMTPSSTPATTCQNGILTQQNGSSAPCPGNVTCANASSCRSGCTSRTDCSSYSATCSLAQNICVPDAVSVAAQAQGITPSTWTPEVHRTPNEVAALIQQAGVTIDDAGRAVFDELSASGLTPVFDPSLKNPVVGFNYCLTRIQGCSQATNGDLDGCIAVAPRCVSSSPWQDDPAGFDCCPESCLLEYLTDRKTSDAPTSMLEMSDSACYPGLTTFLNGGAP